MESNISVIIPTYNRGKTVNLTLKAIVNLDPAPFQVIVVDQSDFDKREMTYCTVRNIAASVGWSFTVEHEEEPVAEPGRIILIQSDLKGLSRSRNTGSKRATGDILFFADDDIIPEKNWLSAMITGFNEPDIWAVYGQILPYKTGGKQDGVELTRVGQVSRVFCEPVLPWHMGSGGNMALRRSFLIDKAHGMDEFLCIGGKFKSGEDLDIFYRALIFGGKVAFTPASVVFHNSEKSFKEQLKTEAGYGIGIGAAIYKYWKCGDSMAFYMLLKWVWQMGVRRLGAGLLKWRSKKVMQLALLQFWYPFVGLWQAHRQPVDRSYWHFQNE